MVSRFASRLPAFQALRRFERSRGKAINHISLLTMPRQIVILLCPSTARRAATEDGEAHGSAMFELRERDELPQPCQSTTEDGHLVPPCKLQSGNSKETKQKFVARTHRERSAQRDAIEVPRHGSADEFHICRDRRVVCPEKKVGHPRAGLAGRACAASGPRVSAGCWRARQLRVFTGRELVAGRASGERSPGARARRRPRARRERSPGERWVLCRALAASFYRERARRHA